MAVIICQKSLSLKDHLHVRFMRCVFAVFTLAIVYMDNCEISIDGFVKIARIGTVTTLDRPSEPSETYHLCS